MCLSDSWKRGTLKCSAAHMHIVPCIFFYKWISKLSHRSLKTLRLNWLVCLFCSMWAGSKRSSRQREGKREWKARQVPAEVRTWSWQFHIGSYLHSREWSPFRKYINPYFLSLCFYCSDELSGTESDPEESTKKGFLLLSKIMDCTCISLLF